MDAGRDIGSLLYAERGGHHITTQSHRSELNSVRNGNETEDVEHVVTKGQKYNNERNRLEAHIVHRGRKWSVEGVVSVEQGGPDCFRPLMRLIEETGPGRRIQVTAAG